MSGEFLFELVEKCQWSSERKRHLKQRVTTWPWNTSFFNWLNPKVELSDNGQRFLNENEQRTIFSVHLPSNRIAVLNNNRIDIYSINFGNGKDLISIELDDFGLNDYNQLNCLTWSNNGKYIGFGHWSGVVSVYSSDDGQLIHKMSNHCSIYREDSFVDIWFSGSDGSQFIDFLCLKRSGHLIRYVMSRYDIASCAQEKIDFEITTSIYDQQSNLIYLVPFKTKSIVVYRLVDTTPSIIKSKEYIDDYSSENQSSRSMIVRLIVSPSTDYLVSLMSDRKIHIFNNQQQQQLKIVGQIEIDSSRPTISDLSYWDDKTLILFYSNGSMSFHKGNENLDEYRYETNQLNGFVQVCPKLFDGFYVVDQRSSILNKSIENNSSSKVRYFMKSSTNDEKQLIEYRLIRVERCYPDRLIFRLAEIGDFGEALRVCQVFDRIDLSDEIYEKQIRLSSRQSQIHLSRIRSRIRLLQLLTTLIYPTIDEQYQFIEYGLNQAIKRDLFVDLTLSDRRLSMSIDEENQLDSVKQINIEHINLQQKQILVYRRRLIDQKRKLVLIDQSINQDRLFDQYQVNLFDKFRSWSYTEIAQRFARLGQIQGIRLVLKYSIPMIKPDELLSIIELIPVDRSIIDYQDLIQMFFSIESFIDHRTEIDWSEEFLSKDDQSCPSIDNKLLINSFKSRMIEFESNGFIVNALDFVDLIIEYPMFKDQFQDIREEIRFEYFFNCYFEENLTLENIRSMSQQEIVSLIICSSNDISVEELEKRFDSILIPSIGLFKKIEQIFERIFIVKLENNEDIYSSIRLIKQKEIISNEKFNDFIRSIIFRINSSNQLSIGQQIVKLIDQRGDLEQNIESCQLFVKWSINIFPAEFIKISSSDESFCNALTHLVQSAVKQQSSSINLSFGNELYRDLEQINSFRLPPQTISNLFLSTLLKSGYVQCFPIVRSIYSRCHYGLIVQCCIDYLDSSTNSQDKNFLLAKQCLELIDDPSLVHLEKSLIESQQIFDYFHYKITPIEIRRHRKPIDLIRSVLKKNRQSYLNPSKLISLSLNLPMEEKIDRKNCCLLMIAEHCFEIDQIDLCWDLVSRLVKENYRPTSNILFKLIQIKSSIVNRSILTFLILNSDKFQLDQFIEKSILNRNCSIDQNQEENSMVKFEQDFFYDRSYSKRIEFINYPLIKSFPLDQRSIKVYLNIDTALFLLVSLTSIVQKYFKIDQENKYLLELIIFLDGLSRKRNFNNFFLNPSKLIEKSSVEENEFYQRLLLIRENCLINQLDKTIDLKRFEEDLEYRRLTIEGLFMVDQPQFDKAERLAMKYFISIDHCHLLHIEHILTSSTIDIRTIREKIFAFLQTERFKTNRQIKSELGKILDKNVFKFIDGKDSIRLRIFYEIKNFIGSDKNSSKDLENLDRLLELFEINKFDYKILQEDPQKFIQLYGNNENILQLGSILDKLNDDRIQLNKDFVYSNFLRENLWCGEKTIEILKQIENIDLCSNLVEEILDKIDLRHRFEFIEILQKENIFHRLNEDLKQRKKNIENLLQWISIDDQDKFIDQFEKTKDKYQQIQLLAKIIINKKDWSILFQTSQSFFNSIDLNHLFIELVEQIDNKLKRENCSIEEFLSIFDQLQSDKFDKDILLKSFLQISKVEHFDRKIRFRFLEKINEIFEENSIGEEQWNFIEEYRLTTLLSTFESFEQFKIKKLENDQQRFQFFIFLIDKAEKQIQIESLIKILQDLWFNVDFKLIDSFPVKNRIIIRMIELGLDWIKIFDEKLLEFNEKEIHSLIDFCWQNPSMKIYCYKIWLVYPVVSFDKILFETISESMIDETFLRMSIDRDRIEILFEINDRLIDFYLDRDQEDLKLIQQQINKNKNLLFQSTRIFLYQQKFKSNISFSLIVDQIRRSLKNSN